MGHYKYYIFVLFVNDLLFIIITQQYRPHWEEFFIRMFIAVFVQYYKLEKCLLHL